MGVADMVPAPVRVAGGVTIGAVFGSKLARDEDRVLGAVVGGVLALFVLAADGGFGFGDVGLPTPGEEPGRMPDQVDDADAPSWRRWPCTDPAWWRDVRGRAHLEELVAAGDVTLAEVDCAASSVADRWQRRADGLEDGLELESTYP